MPSAYYYSGSPSGCGYGDGSLMGSGYDSGCRLRRRRLMSCYDELEAVDMDKDGIASMEEMKMYDPCFDEAKDMAWMDLTEDGVLDAADCQADEEMMAKMMSDSMEGSCGGTSEATD